MLMWEALLPPVMHEGAGNPPESEGETLVPVGMWTEMVLPEMAPSTGCPPARPAQESQGTFANTHLQASDNLALGTRCC